MFSFLAKIPHIILDTRLRTRFGCGSVLKFDGLTCPSPKSEPNKASVCISRDGLQDGIRTFLCENKRDDEFRLKLPESGIRDYLRLLILRGKRAAASNSRPFKRSSLSLTVR